MNVKIGLLATNDLVGRFVCIAVLGRALLLLASLSTALCAQEVKVLGDRSELQRVLDAYKQLTVTLESYDAAVECSFQFGGSPLILGKYSISKKGSIYDVAVDIDKENMHFNIIYYLDAKLGLFESVDSRNGVIKTSRKDKAKWVVSEWAPMAVPLTSPIDIDCCCIRDGYHFRSLIDPEYLKGITREIGVEKAANGNIVLTRKYPSGKTHELIASPEFGYLLVSYRDVVQTKPEQGTLSVDFSWLKLPDGKMVPKSKKFTHQFPTRTDSKTWEVTSFSVPSTKTEMKKYSLSPPVGWKIIDLETKAEKVIGGEEGKRVRALLDSVNRVQIELP